MRASRGADPKRPTEPRRAEGWLDTHLRLTAPAPMGGDPAIEAGGRAGRTARTWTMQPRASVAIVNGRGVVTALRRARRGEASTTGTSHTPPSSSRRMASVPECLSLRVGLKADLMLARKTTSNTKSPKMFEPQKLAESCCVVAASSPYPSWSASASSRILGAAHSRGGRARPVVSPRRPASAVAPSEEPSGAPIANLH